MPDPIFERYKEALRAGHVAALRGRPDDALQHYRVAASIAPDRALPHIGMADVLLRLGRHEEALAASAAALRLAPLDEAGLDLTGRIHAAAGRGGDAAGCLDRLADILEGQGRTEDACSAATRAMAADPTDARRDRLGALQSAVDAERARLAESVWTPGTVDGVGAVPAVVLTGAPASAPRPAATAQPAPSASLVSLTAPARPTAQVVPREPRPRVKPAAATGMSEPAAPGEPAGSSATAEASELERPSGTTAAPAQPGGPLSSKPVNPDELFVTAEDLASEGKAREAARLYVDASMLYLEAGASDTAVDACLRALATAPAETDVHLTLARIDLATGHDGRAAEKLDLLARLLSLERDEDGLTRVAAFRELASPPGGGTRAHRHARRAAES